MTRGATSGQLDDFDGPDRREVGKISQPRSRPSKTNRTSPSEASTRSDVGGEAETSRSKWWRRKNELVDEFVDEWPARAARPVSVSDDVTLREDAALERVSGDTDSTENPSYRSDTWSGVLRSFLDWYNGYRNANLRFAGPDGETVRAPMQNSHQPYYGNTYYARLKALERQVVEQYDDLHVAMLTLSGSSSNANGGWRCPADHLRDVVNSWRPDSGRGVYHTLRDALSGKEWEYALVVEPHKSGYGHVHVAIFVDGAVDESDFHGAIDAHLRQCPIAGPDAHDYHDPDPETRPISVSRVDPDLDPEEYEDVHEGGAVGNMSSYVAKYIGQFGGELFDRGLDELTFRAAAWATGTQRVRFSNGASDLIADDLDRDDGGRDPLPSAGWKAGTTEEDLRAATADDDGLDVADYVDGERGWSLDGIERVTEEGPELHQIEQSGVRYVRVEDASHLDPPKRIAFRRPTRRTASGKLTDYGA